MALDLDDGAGWAGPEAVAELAQLRAERFRLARFIAVTSSGFDLLAAQEVTETLDLAREIATGGAPELETARLERAVVDAAINWAEADELTIDDAQHDLWLAVSALHGG